MKQILNSEYELFYTTSVMWTETVTDILLSYMLVLGTESLVSFTSYKYVTNVLFWNKVIKSISRLLSCIFMTHYETFLMKYACTLVLWYNKTMTKRTGCCD